jgi:hypothetical protein
MARRNQQSVTGCERMKSKHELIIVIIILSVVMLVMCIYGLLVDTSMYVYAIFNAIIICFGFITLYQMG